ncbi:MULTISPECIES: hypothetical protein [unclassified Meiothermus]|uniref:hypothetical protein n=1 Tax=unclassified Meiothermus TaxID=370471 RepID=UPI00157F84D6|nr:MULTISPECIES: hypothetical protein [unclassified Meiothermus]
MLAWLVTLALAQPSAYFPNGVGLSWTYSSGEEQVFARQKDGFLMLEHRYAGRARYADLLRYDATGVYLEGVYIGGAVQKYAPPLQLYPSAPLIIGQEWGMKSSIQGQVVAFVAKVTRLEGVQVPAGKFNAYVIRTSLVTQSGGSSVVESYFVPGVGVVRFVGADGSKVDLVKFVRP